MVTSKLSRQRAQHLSTLQRRVVDHQQASFWDTNWRPMACCFAYSPADCAHKDCHYARECKERQDVVGVLAPQGAAAHDGDKGHLQGDRWVGGQAAL